MDEQNETIALKRDRQSIRLRQGYGGALRIHIPLQFKGRPGRHAS